MIKVTVITPKLLPAALFTATATAAMHEVNELLFREFAKTTATWHNKPEFTKTVTEEPGRVIGEVATTNDIYRYVSGGTSVRYATMTPDFIAKTQPRVIASGSGRGGLLFVSRQYPRPGIEAREFDVTIAKQQEKKIAKLLQAAISRAVSASGQEMK